MLEESAKEQGQADPLFRPLVSLVVPAYNEASILEKNRLVLCKYMESLENKYSWELIIVNDGSQDETGNRAQAFAKTRTNVFVVHHMNNLGLGQALRTGFDYCQGDYIITLDIDLSYAPDDHIERLLSQLRTTHAQVVVASPYRSGGKVSNVPQLRRLLSVWANWFLFIVSDGSVRTLTGMVRAYDAKFIRSLNLTARGMEINPEVIYKTKLLNGQIAEIPAHLRWLPHNQDQQRQSSMKIFQQIRAILGAGFLFRPALFFWLPGLVCFLMGGYAIAGILIDYWTNYHSIAVTFQQTPSRFLFAGLMLFMTILLVGLGVLSRQIQIYFEELFNLGTTIYKTTKNSLDSAKDLTREKFHEPKTQDHHTSFRSR